MHEQIEHEFSYKDHYHKKNTLAKIEEGKMRLT